MLNESAIFTAATGYVYVGPTGTTKPTPVEITAHDPVTGLGVGWTDLGHTSREDLPEFGFEGGDTETRGTWRAAALREVVTEVAVDYVIVRLHQFDDEGLALYYGVENASAVEGEFAVANTSTATVERALCIVMEDGASRIGFYAPRVSVRRDDAIEMGVDEFSILPIRATFLKNEGAGDQNLFTWVNEDVLNPIGS